VYGWLWRFS